MTTSHNYRAANPQHEILACQRGHRLIGHILEQDGQYHAQSWPAEILIGIYTSRVEAMAAIAHAAKDDIWEDEADKEVTVQSFQVPADPAELFAQTSEIIAHHRSAESIALFRYFHDRGFHSDDLMLLAADALQRYADENPL